MKFENFSEVFVELPRKLLGGFQRTSLKFFRGGFQNFSEVFGGGFQNFSEVFVGGFENLSGVSGGGFENLPEVFGEVLKTSREFSEKF